MILIPDDIRVWLLANGAAATETDHFPVVKLFDPAGAANWLLTEMSPDGDTLFGLCDLGFGAPELGSVSLAELQSVKSAFGLGIERDLWLRRAFRSRFIRKPHAWPAASPRSNAFCAEPPSGFPIPI